MLVIELGDPGRKLRMVNHAISLARADFDVQAKYHFSAHIMTLLFWYCSANLGELGYRLELGFRGKLLIADI